MKKIRKQKKQKALDKLNTHTLVICILHNKASWQNNKATCISNMFSICLVVRLVYFVPSYYWYIKHVITNKATVLIDLP